MAMLNEEAPDWVAYANIPKNSSEAIQSCALCISDKVVGEF